MRKILWLSLTVLLATIATPAFGVVEDMQIESVETVDGMSGPGPKCASTISLPPSISRCNPSPLQKQSGSE